MSLIRKKITGRNSLARSGSTFAPAIILKVHVKVIEGTRENSSIRRCGYCRHGAGISKPSPFPCKKIPLMGAGVERTSPASPQKIRQTRSSQDAGKFFRRAKLYYLRELQVEKRQRIQRNRIGFSRGFDFQALFVFSKQP